jgi:hypothetical protein
LCQVLLRDAGAWELVNIPVDDAIDLFDSLHEAIAKSELEKKVTFDHLFHWVKEYTMEELGVWGFYEIFEACACMKATVPQKFDKSTCLWFFKCFIVFLWGFPGMHVWMYE